MLHSNYLFMYSFPASDFAFPLGENYIVFIFLFILGIMYGIVPRVQSVVNESLRNEQCIGEIDGQMDGLTTECTCYSLESEAMEGHIFIDKDSLILGQLIHRPMLTKMVMSMGRGSCMDSCFPDTDGYRRMIWHNRILQRV